MSVKISLICSTYNQPRFLEFVLDSIRFQTYKDFELIIADDGSSEETKKLIDSYSDLFTQKVHHLWHEDQGWRKSQIHNLAIKKAAGEVLVFIDGDCILDKDFLKDHYRIFQENKKNYVLMGRRVELGVKLTSELSLSNYRDALLSKVSFKLFMSCIKSDSRGYLRRLSLKNKVLRSLFNANNVNDLLGCNFSTTKDCMERINGFNEEYERGEDGDIFVRLRNSNFKIIGMKYYAVMFHLWHARGDYQYVDDNYHKILKLTDYTWAKKGLN